MQSLDHDTRQGRAAGAGTATSVSVAIAGSGGSGVMTAGTMLLDAAARAGLYGLMVRTSGPQIRGGEAAALLRFARAPMDALDDAFDLLLAIDWQNVNRFADEIPLRATQPGGRRRRRGRGARGASPPAARAACALPLKKMAKAIPGSWTNMLALGLAGGLAGIPASALEAALRASWKRSDAGLQANLAALRAGLAEADKLAGGGMARLAAGAAATGPALADQRQRGRRLRRAARRACASSPPTRSPRPPNCWSGWRRR